MHEHVGVLGRGDDGRGGSGVAAQDELSPGARGAENLARRHDGAVRQRHRFPPLESAALGPGRDAEAIRDLDVEASGPVVLDEGVAERGVPVAGRKREQPVVVALEHVARRELDELVRIRESAEDPSERAHQLAEAARAVDRQRQLATAQGEGLQHSREAEEMVGVEVGQEDLAQLDEADVGAQELPLRALGAVEQEPLAAAPDERRGGRAPGGGHRAGRPDEDDVEVHAASLGRAPQDDLPG